MLARRDPTYQPAQDFNQAVWDRWNAPDPAGSGVTNASGWRGVGLHTAVFQLIEAPAGVPENLGDPSDKPRRSNIVGVCASWSCLACVHRPAPTGRS